MNLENRFLIFCTAGFGLQDLILHSLSVLVDALAGEIQKQGAGFNSHVCLMGKDCMSVSVPSVACGIKEMAKSCSDTTCSEA
jgi:hypothetical protein